MKANFEVLPRSMQVVVALALVALLAFPFVAASSMPAWWSR
jgi:hypothetical protein